MSPPLIFDTTCLSNFARAGRFATLEAIVGTRRCIAPAEVMHELQAGSETIADLVEVLTADWLESLKLIENHELAIFARYKTQLGGGISENLGEAAVLALAKVHGGVAIIDERAASRIAQRDGIIAHGSLWLIVQGIRIGELDRSDAEQLVDELRDTGMRLPTSGNELFTWAQENGLLQ